MKKIAAIFDVDNTIIKGQSQNYLAKLIYKKGEISFSVFAEIFLTFLRSLFIISKKSSFICQPLS